MTLKPSPRALTAVLGVLVGVVSLFAAPPARAGVLVASAPDCDDQVLEQPFLPWLDPASYVLVPDGDLSAGGAGWQLSSASIAEENEPYQVHGAGPARSVALPPGSSATSPALCVGLLHPTLRFFARNTGTTLGTLRVEVLFEDAAGNVRALPIGQVLGHRGWSPTLPMPVIANLLPLLPGQHTAVAFRFTPSGPGSSWLIDDVYVDPYRKT
jgi:hypothetical protein